MNANNNIHSGSRGPQIVMTDPRLLHVVQERWGKFQCDVAALPENSVAPMFITPEQDALVTPWSEWNWCNPPFRMFGKFTARAHQQAVDGECNTCLLAIASLSTNWWKENVHGKARVIPIQRPRFVGHDADFPKDMAMLLYGPDFEPGYEERWDWKKEL